MRGHKPLLPLFAGERIYMAKHGHIKEAPVSPEGQIPHIKLQNVCFEVRIPNGISFTVKIGTVQVQPSKETACAGELVSLWHITGPSRKACEAGYRRAGKLDLRKSKQQDEIGESWFLLRGEKKGCRPSDWKLSLLATPSPELTGPNWAINNL